VSQDEHRRLARELARQYLARGEPTGWFEPLYREAAAGRAAIPWADMKPNPNLVAWAREAGLSGRGRRALKIGCGLDDERPPVRRFRVEYRRPCSGS
jgi:hypothetical protein